MNRPRNTDHSHDLIRFRTTIRFRDFYGIFMTIFNVTEFETAQCCTTSMTSLTAQLDIPSTSADTVFFKLYNFQIAEMYQIMV